MNQRSDDPAIQDEQQRLLTLVGAAGTLLQSPRVQDVLPATIKLAQDLIVADAYTVWRLDPVRNLWQIGASTGVSDAFALQIIDAYQRVGSPLSEPLVAEDVMAPPQLVDRKRAYEVEGIRSLLAIPLTIHDEGAGTLVFYYRKTHAFSDLDVQMARALGHSVAAALTVAELYEEQERQRVRASLLAQAGAALSSSLDYDTTLKAVPHLSVPDIADWCAVDILGKDGDVQRLGVAQISTADAETARRLQAQYPQNSEGPDSIGQVIRTGRSVLSPDRISVPLIVHGHILGAVTLATLKSERRYGSADLQFAQEIAYRAALAAENARAYHQANEANRLKDEFLGTLSHELRTPLNGTLGWLSMLLNESLPPEKTVHAIEAAYKNACAQVQIVDDLLDVSRITRGHLELTVQPTDMGTVAHDATEAVRTAARAKGIVLAVDVQNPVMIDCDPARVRQIIWNLVSNAVKFTPAGGHVNVTVRQDTGHVVVTVSDNGCGISPMFLPFVFDRFRQGDSSNTRAHGGLGLGLAIVRQLAELHGGHVRASSDGAGTGSTFEVSLPVHAAARAAEPQRAGEPETV